jgi:polyketide cyclase/dehydrase/lipid transport protein
MLTRDDKSFRLLTWMGIVPGLLAAAVLIVLHAAPVMAEAQVGTIRHLSVVKDGNAVTVEATLFAPVAVEDAWNVLSDFDHMAEFVPDLERSRIVSKPGEPLVLVQKGVARFGPFWLTFETERTVELIPHETIKTRLIRGNMRKMEGTLHLAAEAGGTRITYHADAIAGFWVPPLLGTAFIRHEVREQLLALILEMMRRRTVPKAAPTLSPRPAGRDQAGDPAAKL